MELQELKDLAEALEVAKLRELDARRGLIDAEKTSKKVEANIIASAYRDGVIDGKNADIRKRQEGEVLSGTDMYIDHISSVFAAQEAADAATAELVGLEAEVGLTKAWLYSQAKLA